MNNQDEKIEIIKETPDYIALIKPAGLLTHKGPKTGDEESVAGLITKIRTEIGKIGDDPVNRPGIVHRLDKETSGLMIVAKTNAFFNYFKGLLQNKLVKKTYLGLVYGKIEKKMEIKKPIGIINGTLRRSTKSKKIRMLKPAVTLIEPEQNLFFNNQPLTLLKIQPLTGRTHQIRVHLASIGHPIVGDKLYGPKTNPLNLNRHFLHAASLEFTDSHGEKIKLESALPEDLFEILTFIKNQGRISK